jgi:acyl-coenzyme A thioesterase PaaI-like protein
LGDDGLQAVTTNLTINFLSRPQPADLTARVRILKLGRKLAVCEAALYAEGNATMIAHATATYAIPPPGMSSPGSR